MPKVLMEAAELATQRDDPRLVIIDCRFDLQRPEWGEQAYAEAHIPGARYAHLDRDLSAPIGPQTGRHPLPDPEALAARLHAWGIEESTRIVAYDQGNGIYAARLWWLLRWLGLGNACVLDGGFAAWRAAGYPERAGAEPSESRQPRSAFVARPARALWVDVGELPRARDAGLLVDARAADRYAGENETMDPKAGHVPGARNHPFTRNLDAAGRFLPPERLRELWAQTLGGRPPSALVSMCGSGVTACHNLLALEHAGLGGGRLYPGSWSEWIRDPSRAVATGPEP